MLGRSTPRTNTCASGIPSDVKMRSCMSCPAVAVNAKIGGEPRASRTSLRRPYSGRKSASPLVHAVGLVDHQKCRTNRPELLLLIGAPNKEPLWRHIKQLEMVALPTAGSEGASHWYRCRY